MLDSDTSKIPLNNTFLKACSAVGKSIQQMASKINFYFFLLLVPSLCQAKDPFSKGGNWITMLLQDMAPIGLTAVIAVCGIAWWLQKITSRLAFSIVGGAALIFGASYLSDSIVTAIK